mmetsp:Transcript_126940/g.365099  ORF Transcript_126940/g.365099 Transcript_126940/m.365099 type:complete len:463 (+) Transcript_126940:79-1467(+)
MAAALPPRCRLLLAIVLAACRALHVGAARLQARAGSASGSAGRARVEGRSAARSDMTTPHDRNLDRVAEFVEGIDPMEPQRLSEIREILERFDEIRIWIAEHHDPRDPLASQLVENVLRGIRQKAAALAPAAERLQAIGQSDDGGDELPSDRDSICKQPEEDVGFSDDFRVALVAFCDSLDAVHNAVFAGHSAELPAFSVAGALSVLTVKPEYNFRNIGWAIDCVLGEERRWIARQLARHAAEAAAAGAEGSEDDGAEERAWALRGWTTGVLADLEDDSEARQARALSFGRRATESADAAARFGRSLPTVRLCIERLDHARDILAVRRGTSPAFRELAEDLLLEVEEWQEALDALAEQKVLAGELDESIVVLPSERDNICNGIDELDFDPDFMREVKCVCNALDNFHMLAMDGEADDMAIFEVLGRMAALERRPGYWDSPIAYEIDVVLTNEIEVIGNAGLF